MTICAKYISMLIPLKYFIGLDPKNLLSTATAYISHMENKIGDLIYQLGSRYHATVATAQHPNISHRNRSAKRANTSRYK